MTYDPPFHLEGPETDVTSLCEGYITVTPLHFDLTRYDAIAEAECLELGRLNRHLTGAIHAPAPSVAGIRRNQLRLAAVFSLADHRHLRRDAPGCEEETRNAGKRPETRALDQTGVSVGLDETLAHKHRPGHRAKQSGPIIGQRTTDIRACK